MCKTAIMHSLALAIEWDWLKIKCWRRVLRVVWKRKLFRKGKTLLTLSERMTAAVSRARELEGIYNTLYFGSD